MAGETARIVTTRFADVMIAIDDAADEAREPAAAALDDGGGSGVDNGDGDAADDLANIEEVDAEVEAAAGPASANGGKLQAGGASAKSMQRRMQPRKTSRYEPPVQERKKAKKGQQPPSGEQQPSGTPAATAPHNVVLNCDGLPYTRGPYRKRVRKAATADGAVADAKKSCPRKAGAAEATAWR
eukprot:362746-Pleurochrysis_carterae.AAC.2